MLKGVSWTATSQVLTQLVTLATMVILARVLGPSDFGVVGMAALYTGLVMVIGQIGMGAAVIQRKTISDLELDTVFWTGLAVAVVVTVLSVVLAPVSGWFFHSPLVVTVIRVASLAYVIDSLGATQRVLMNKEMEFDRLARTEVGAAMVYAAVATSLAFAGAGVWAIVFGQLARSSVEVILLWVVQPWRPKLRFSKDALAGIFGFSSKVWAFSFVDYARENIDNLAVGRLLGASSLGHYALAYNTAYFPRRQIQSVIGRVTFPAFAKAQDDDELLRRAYIKVTRYVSLVAFPLQAGLALVAPALIPMVYGDKWTPAVLPLQLLSVAQMFYSVGFSVGSIFLAKNRPDIHLNFGLLAFVWLAVVVAVTVRFGIVAVAGGILFYTMGSVLVSQGLANPLIGLRMRDYLAALVPATVGCAVMAVALTALRVLVLDVGMLAPALGLLVAIALGAAAYIGTVALFRLPETSEVFKLVRDRFAILRTRSSSGSTPTPDDADPDGVVGPDIVKVSAQ